MKWHGVLCPFIIDFSPQRYGDAGHHSPPDLFTTKTLRKHKGTKSVEHRVKCTVYNNELWTDRL